jgi:thymidylate synthase (FAD)
VEKKLNVKLLRFTPNPTQAVATAARLCYSNAEIKDLLEKMTPEKSEALLKNLVELGHESPTEHASFTFGIEGVSRALTHQLVRHRIASYSQQSQRYVEAKDFGYIIPPSIKSDPKKKEKFEKAMNELAALYGEFAADIPKEDARFILPNSAETKIIVTMNARSLKNLFRLRCCARAQWEIRQLAQEMLKQCKGADPILFSKMGESCISEGICPEGKMSCGKWKSMPGVMLRIEGKLVDKATYEREYAGKK